MFENRQSVKQYDVAIFGSGIIGLFCAWKLSRENLRVIVLEKGGKRPVLPNGNFKYLKENYNGAMAGRRIGLGGTSGAWGGALIPSQKEDLLRFYDKSYVKRLLNGVEQIESFFGLDRLSYENTDTELKFFSDSFTKRSAKWIGVRDKNAYNRLRKFKQFWQKSDLILNVNIGDYLIKDNKINGVEIFENNTKQIITFDNLIFAAGAIGNVELLADIHTKLGHELPVQLGKHLSDHLSIPIVALKFPRNLEKYFSKHYGQLFVKRTYRRDFRVESSWLKNEDIPAFFLHFTQDGTKAFNLIRKLLSSLENKQKIILQDFLSLISLLPAVMNLIYFRVRWKRLHMNSSQKLIVYCVIEKPVNEFCKIRICNKKVASERYLEIQWEIFEDDIKPVYHIQDQIFNDLYKKYHKIGVIVEKLSIAKPGAVHYEGIYHPTGVTSSDSKDGLGVVSLEGRVHGFENLYSISTGNLPRGGGTNPTMNGLLIANIACAAVLENCMKTRLSKVT